MKNKIYCLIILSFLLSTNIKAQLYVAFAPYMTNAVGNLSTKFSPAIEFGKQWDVMSIGFDIGKTNCSPYKGKDTTLYFEFKPNLNVFQQGKFTNTFTPGIGYVPGCKSLMLEMTMGIEYSFTDRFHVNMFFGQYYYSGLTSSSAFNFFGLSLVKFFSTYKSTSLIKLN